ncbi:hypothetical protein Tco_0537532 [Tanacetum coccineum]
MTPTLTAASPQRKKRKQSVGETSSPRKSLKVTIKEKKQSTTPIPPPGDDRERDEMDEATLISLTLYKTALTAEAQDNVAKKDDKNDEDEEKDDDVEKTGDAAGEKDNADHTDQTLVGTHAMSRIDRHCITLNYHYIQRSTKGKTYFQQPTITTSTDTTSSPDLQQQLYLKMKSNLQDQANDPALDVDFHLQHHDDHQDDDAPPEGEKRVKRHKIFKSSKSTRGSSSKRSIKESTTYLVPTTFDRARMEATLNDMVSNQFRNAEEYAYHLEQATNFMENQLVWESRQEDIRRSIPKALIFYGSQKNPNEPLRDNPEDYFSNHRITEVVRITTNQLYGLDFMKQIVMRENDKQDRFSKADFKYLNKHDIEDLYYLCQNKKVNYCETKLMNSLITFIRSRMIWERVHDFKLGIESYQIKINLTAPTLIFPGIEAHDPYSIVDKANMGLIYLNSKDEKRVMYLVEIAKFCDATLETVLNEVKVRIFQNQFWKKPPLLGELYLDIMKAFEREITKRLRHHEHMRSANMIYNKKELRQCIFDDPYVMTEITILAKPTTTTEEAVPEHNVVETYKNVTLEKSAYFDAKAEVIHMILSGIRDDIYSTVDACTTTKEMWIAIERLQQGESLNKQDVKTNLFWEFYKFNSRDGVSDESYYSRFYKMMNEIIRNKLQVATMQVNVQFL